MMASSSTTIPGVPAQLQTLAAVLLRLARNPLASEFRRSVVCLHPEVRPSFHWRLHFATCDGLLIVTIIALSILSPVAGQKYLHEIKRPMDIGKLNRYLRRGRYLHGREQHFYEDTLLMFKNCRQFNVRSPVLHALSDHLTRFFDDMWFEWVWPQVTAAAAAAASDIATTDPTATNSRNKAIRLDAAGKAAQCKLQRRADRSALVSQVPLAALGERDAALIDAAADVCGLRKGFTRTAEGRRTTFGSFLVAAHRALASLEARAGANAGTLEVGRRREIFGQVYAEVTLFVAERLRRGAGSSSTWARPLRLVWARRSSSSPYWPAMLLAYIGSPDPVLPAESIAGSGGSANGSNPGVGGRNSTPKRGVGQSERTLGGNEWAPQCSPHAFLQEMNYGRIPGYMRSSLDANLEKMKRQCAHDAQDFMLVEFFGLHDFAWVQKDRVMPYVPGDQPNTRPVRHNKFKTAQHEVLDLMKSTDERVLSVLKETLECRQQVEGDAGSSVVPPNTMEECLQLREQALLKRWTKQGPVVALGDVNWLVWKTADDDDDVTEAIGFLPEDGEYDSDNSGRVIKSQVPVARRTKCFICKERRSIIPAGMLIVARFASRVLVTDTRRKRFREVACVSNGSSCLTSHIACT